MNGHPDPDEDAELVRREREWLLERLAEIPADRARLDERERLFVRNARANGTGWDEIGEALGITGAEALGKHGEPPPDEAPF